MTEQTKPRIPANVVAAMLRDNKKLAGAAPESACDGNCAGCKGDDDLAELEAAIAGGALAVNLMTGERMEIANLADFFERLEQRAEAGHRFTGKVQHNDGEKLTAKPEPLNVVAGKVYKTRNGKKARVLATDVKGDRDVAAIGLYEDTPDSELVAWWYKNGQHASDNDALDLVAEWVEPKVDWSRPTEFRIGKTVCHIESPVHLAGCDNVAFTFVRDGVGHVGLATKDGVLLDPGSEKPMYGGKQSVFNVEG